MAVVPLSSNPRGRRLVIITSVFMVLDFVFVAARLYSRRLKGQNLDVNDWAIVVTTAFILGHYAVEVHGVRHGLGIHVQEILENHGGIPTIMEAGKSIYAALIIWCLANLFAKLSILHLYIVLFRPVRQFRYTVYGIMGFCVALLLALAGAAAGFCHPVARNWDPTITQGSCGDLLVFSMASLVLNMVTDVVIFLLPMPLFYQLKLSSKRRWASMFVFGTGLLICTISGIRIIWMLELDTADPTYSILIPAIFGQLEPQLAIISACLPMLPPVIAHFSGGRYMQWAGQSSSSGRSGGSYQQPSISLTGSEHQRPGRKQGYAHTSDEQTRGHRPSSVSKSHLLDSRAGSQSEHADGIVVTTDISVASKSQRSSQELAAQRRQDVFGRGYPS